LAEDDIKLQELLDYVSIVIGDITSEEVTLDEFRKIANKSLMMYNAYCPDEHEFIAVINGSLLNGGGGYLFSPPYPIVASASPQYAGLNWWSDISSPTSTYDSKTGTLTVPMTGTYIVKYGVLLTVATVNEIDHPLFYKLLEAYYKIVVGSRRKKFALMDYQIQNDGDSMVQEGTTLLEEIKLDLQDNLPFWLSFSTR
jgi:hypothetical protein